MFGVFVSGEKFPHLHFSGLREQTALGAGNQKLKPLQSWAPLMMLGSPEQRCRPVSRPSAPPTYTSVGCEVGRPPSRAQPGQKARRRVCVRGDPDFELHLCPSPNLRPWANDLTLSERQFPHLRNGGQPAPGHQRTAAQTE